MLKDMIDPTRARPKPTEALEILRKESQPKYFQDWPVLFLIVVYGIASSFLGSEYLMLFLFLATCLAMAMHRNQQRRTNLARAILALLDEKHDHESPLKEKR